MSEPQVIGGLAAVLAPLCAQGWQRRRPTDRFIATHLPLWWVQQAVQAGAGALAWALCYYWGMAHGKPFKASLEDLAVVGISCAVARRQLHALEQAGLIRVHRSSGCKGVVTMLVESPPGDVVASPP